MEASARAPEIAVQPYCVKIESRGHTHKGLDTADGEISALLLAVRAVAALCEHHHQRVNKSSNWALSLPQNCANLRVAQGTARFPTGFLQREQQISSAWM